MLWRVLAASVAAAALRGLFLARALRRPPDSARDAAAARGSLHFVALQRLRLRCQVVRSPQPKKLCVPVRLRRWLFICPMGWIEHPRRVVRGILVVQEVHDRPSCLWCRSLVGRALPSVRSLEVQVVLALRRFLRMCSQSLPSYHVGHPYQESRALPWLRGSQLQVCPWGLVLQRSQVHRHLPSLLVNHSHPRQPCQVLP